MSSPKRASPQQQKRRKRPVLTREDVKRDLAESKEFRRKWKKQWISANAGRKGPDVYISRMANGRWSYIDPVLGYFVTHCGHPTALYPYVGYTPHATLYAPNGKCFSKLLDAQIEVFLRFCFDAGAIAESKTCIAHTDKDP